MADTQVVFIDPKLKELADKVPVELLRAAPERYAALRPSSKGSWKTVLVGGLPAAAVWTDWKNGFDVISLSDSEVTDQLQNYVITAKALDIPAGWAYTALETVVSKWDTEQPVELSAQTDGKLGNIMRNEETQVDTRGELENGTEQES